MNFDPETSEPDAFKIMDRAQDSINPWDSANVFGQKWGEDITEQIIGRSFAQGGGRRGKVDLATRVYGDMAKGDVENWPNTSRLSALHIRQACDDSLKLLQTDHIDL